MYLFRINYPKLKTNLRLAVFKLKLLQRKKIEITEKVRKEIAELLHAGKIQKAKTKVEYVIREDYVIDALEIVEMYCDLLLARFAIISNIKELDESLVEAVSSLFWVAPHLIPDVKELKIITDLLTMKYSKQFAEKCREDNVETICKVLKEKLVVPKTPKILVEKYLSEIAKNYNVHYIPDLQLKDEAENVVGSSENLEYVSYPKSSKSPEQYDFSLKKEYNLHLLHSPVYLYSVSPEQPCSSSDIDDDASSTSTIEENKFKYNISDLPQKSQTLKGNLKNLPPYDIANELKKKLYSLTFDNSVSEEETLELSDSENKLYDLPSAYKETQNLSTAFKDKKEPLKNIEDNYIITSQTNDKECGLPLLSPVTIKKRIPLESPSPSITEEYTNDSNDKNYDLPNLSSSANDLKRSPETNEISIINDILPKVPNEIIEITNSKDVTPKVSSTSKENIDISNDDITKNSPPTDVSFDLPNISNVSSVDNKPVNNTEHALPKISSIMSSQKEFGFPVLLSTSSVTPYTSSTSLNDKEFGNTLKDDMLSSKPDDGGVKLDEDSNFAGILSDSNEKLFRLSSAPKDTVNDMAELYKNVTYGLPVTPTHTPEAHKDKKNHLTLNYDKKDSPEFHNEEASDLPKFPSVPTLNPRTNTQKDDDVGLDELYRRFHELKKR